LDHRQRMPHTASAAGIGDLRQSLQQTTTRGVVPQARPTRTVSAAAAASSSMDDAAEDTVAGAVAGWGMTD